MSKFICHIIPSSCPLYQDDKKKGCRKKTWENTISNILKEKSVTLNEANKKVRNKKEWAKCVCVNKRNFT